MFEEHSDEMSHRIVNFTKTVEQYGEQLSEY